MAALTLRLADFIERLDWAAVPPHIQDSARDRLLDGLSTAVAARNVATTRALVSAATGLGGSGDCTVLPTGQTSGLQQAALVNGAAIHAILFEDINLPSADHPGAVIVPAALAAAEASAALTGREATLADLLRGILAGYEIHLWLGRIAATGVRNRGLRTTSLFGTVGAAAAVSAALRTPTAETVTSLAYGANFAFGFLEGFAHGTMEPYIQAGVAAQTGIIACMIGRGGATAAEPTFEGENGYLRGFADMVPGSDIEDHGDWGITGVSCKPYPISGGKIGSTDSALAAYDQGIDPAEIVHVVAYLRPGIQEFPGGNNPGPFNTMNAAQDSTQFCIAAALLGRPMGSLKTVMVDYADADIADLARRVELISDPGRSAIAKVEVHLTGDRVVAGEDDRRHLQRPTIEKMAVKLESLTADYWPAGRAAAVTNVVSGPDDTPVRELSRLLRG